jgi:hypothetical protein
LTKISSSEISGVGTSFHCALVVVKFLWSARFATLEYRVFVVMSAFILCTSGV